MYYPRPAITWEAEPEVPAPEGPEAALCLDVTRAAPPGLFHMNLFRVAPRASGRKCATTAKSWRGAPKTWSSPR